MFKVVGKMLPAPTPAVSLEIHNVIACSNREVPFDSLPVVRLVSRSLGVAVPRLLSSLHKLIQFKSLRVSSFSSLLHLVDTHFAIRESEVVEGVDLEEKCVPSTEHVTVDRFDMHPLEVGAGERVGIQLAEHQSRVSKLGIRPFGERAE